MTQRYTLVIVCFFALGNFAVSQDVDAPSSQRSAQRAQQSRLFHLSAIQGTGLLIPLYLYPANIHTNETYNRLIDLKRKYEHIAFWVIVNPASGPGTQVDANYTKAIDRLTGAGCTVLGYVSTEYSKRAVDKVTVDLKRWQTIYPRIQGVFFDEMNNEDSAEKVGHQSRLTAVARQMDFWPIVTNPGTDVPEPYFSQGLADVIVIHEGEKWPEEKKLQGDYFGGYADYPPWTRAVLVHSMKSLDSSQVSMIRKYVRWIYVTEDLFHPGDSSANNPWDSLSGHLELLCEQLSQRP